MTDLPSRNLALELVRVTETAALAASRWVGKGDKNLADQAAVDAMRALIQTVSMRGTVVIGEGEKDNAPMLYNGELVGNGEGPACDVAVDPIDGTSLTAKGLNNAISVIALSKKGSMLDASSVFYMKKIVTGSEAAGVIDIDAPTEVNIRNVAKAKGIHVEDVTVIVLDRPRHDQLVKEIRATGARIRFISDGDVAGAVLAARPNSGIDLLMGIGGSPEGVIAACAMKCLGGVIQARLQPNSEEERKNAFTSGLDVNRKFETQDLVSSDDVFFAATGITDGELLRGVHYGHDYITSESIVMRGRSGTIRIIQSQYKI